MTVLVTLALGAGLSFGLAAWLVHALGGTVDRQTEAERLRRLIGEYGDEGEGA